MKVLRLLPPLQIRMIASICSILCLLGSAEADEPNAPPPEVAADRDPDSDDWFRMFGYPNRDEAEQYARKTGRPLMIVFR